MSRSLRVAASSLSIAALLAASLALGTWRAGASTPVAAAQPAPATVAPSPWVVPATLRRAPVDFDRFTTLTRADGLPSNRVTTVLVDGEDLWVGTDEGVARRRRGEWSYWTPAQGLAHRYVTSLSLDAATGDLWISTLGGLSRLSGGLIHTYTQLNSGLMNDVVYQVAVDGRGVWAATAAGTSFLDLVTGSWSLWDHENSIMHEPWCYSLTLGAGRAWIGVWGGGVVELELDSGRWKEYRDPDHEMEIDLLRDDGPIHDVTAFVAWDAGVLWQATYFGLSRYDGRRWRTFRKEDSGLPGNFINHVAARGHTAYLGTDEGFGVTDGDLAVTYRRASDGSGEVTFTRSGKLVERRTLSTAPADNYVLWTLPGENDVWLATGNGLSHGTSSASR